MWLVIRCYYKYLIVTIVTLEFALHVTCFSKIITLRHLGISGACKLIYDLEMLLNEKVDLFACCVQRHARTFNVTS